MRLRLITVGKDRSGLYAPAVADYAERLGRYLRFEIVEVPEARKLAGTPRARDEEGEAILDRLKPSDRVVALDERGEQLSSLAFASRIERWMNNGRDVALVIGGSDGLSEPVVTRADEKLALSRLTLAHRLARLVLAEQLYRAMTILRNEPYHK
jgi:23S rRNA (pseudouridine1915-N3)-methyltransferase